MDTSDRALLGLQIRLSDSIPPSPPPLFAFLAFTSHMISHQDPHYVFAIDVSFSAMQSGAVQSAIDAVRSTLVELVRASQQPCSSYFLCSH